MADRAPAILVTLVRRELQEYRSSLVSTPAAIGLSLLFVMLLSVLLANRISGMGDAVLDVIMEEGAQGTDITLHIDNEVTEVIRNHHLEPREEGDDQQRAAGRPPGNRGGLNPVLHLVHNLMILVLLLVTSNYLLGCLFNDRRDSSILFWKSMPVTEGLEVGSKFLVAVLAAPAVYIGVSLLTQLLSVLLAMLMVWRMERDSLELVLGNIAFGRLVVEQFSGWLHMTLWLAPTYAWLMLASAAARRSPFMSAIAPVIGLAVIEQMLLGTRFVATTVARHLPHADERGAVAFYVQGPDWAHQDLPALGAGLLFTAAALWAAAYLRRTRFEI